MKYPQDTVIWTWGVGGGVVLEGVWKEGHDLCCMVRSQMPASLFQFILVYVSLCLCTLASWNKKANKPADMLVRARTCTQLSSASPHKLLF